MKFPVSVRIKLFLKTLIVLAMIGLVILCALLAQEYRHLQRLHLLGAYESRMVTVLQSRPHAPATAQDISSLQSWMTFDYINKLFALPPQYMQTRLGITDSRYPRLTIARYAKDTGMPQASALAQIQNAVRAYLIATHE